MKVLGKRVSPHRIRHSAITEVIEKFGIDKARLFARHSDIKVTQVYDDAVKKRTLEVNEQMQVIANQILAFQSQKPVPQEEPKEEEEEKDMLDGLDLTDII